MDQRPELPENGEWRPHVHYHINCTLIDKGTKEFTGSVQHSMDTNDLVGNYANVDATHDHQHLYSIYWALWLQATDFDRVSLKLSCVCGAEKEHNNNYYLELTVSSIYSSSFFIFIVFPPQSKNFVSFYSYHQHHLRLVSPQNGMEWNMIITRPKMCRGSLFGAQMKPK